MYLMGGMRRILSSRRVSGLGPAPCTPGPRPGGSRGQSAFNGTSAVDAVLAPARWNSPALSDRIDVEDAQANHHQPAC